MRKLFISTSIALALGLVGCGGGETIEDLRAETPVVAPASRVVFNPTAGQLNVPSDFFFALVEQTDDGTLEMPDEVAGQANGNMPDFSNPGAALGAIDGWSVQHPFTFSTSHPAGVSLSNVLAPGAVRVFEGAIGGDINDPDCTTAPPLSGCKVGRELQFGVDFVTRASGNDVAIIPLKPLKGSQTYYIAVTDELTASNGTSLKASTTYELLEQDINTLPLSTDSQLALQGLINSYEAVLASQAGLPREKVIFSFTVTTQSNDNIINTVKQLNIAGFAQAVAGGMNPATAAGQFLPVIRATDAAVDTAFDVLAPTLLGAEQLAALSAVGLDSCSGLIGALSNPASPLFPTASQVFAQVGSFCAANVKTGTINLPYFLDTDAPLTGRWSAACTNGLALSAIGAATIPGLIQSGAVGVGANNDLCQAATGGRLLDLDLTNLGVNDLRHVTRYSPIPARKGSNPDGTETLTIQITVPNEQVVGILASLSDQISPITKPERGWPVAILQHGVTSKKEDFLAISGALSLAGFATVAIDHPLHGSRGFVIDGQIINASGGFGGSPTDYLNLASLLTSRDNLRQSIVDIMGLRLGLNAVADLTGGSIHLDGSRVSFIGQSLGSITGIGALAISNDSLGGQLAAFDSLYAFESSVLSVPGGGIAGFLLESNSFGPLVRGNLAANASADFRAFLGNFAAENGLPPAQALIPAYLAYEQVMTDAQRASLNATFQSFVFAAQTILDAADPNSYAQKLGENTNVLLHEVVGGGQNDDGSTGLPDQVIPNSTQRYPTFAGTEPLINFIGLPSVSSTTQGEGVVRFLAGSHGSILSPSPSRAATIEMQSQAAVFLSTQGGVIQVSNTDVVAN